jgi:predicted HTH transcriptional regulator
VNDKKLHLDEPYKVFLQPNIDDLLLYKEGQHFDRKRKHAPKDLAQFLVSFANANLKGGLLLIGVDDDGSVIGLQEAYGEDYRNALARCREYVSHIIPEYKFLSLTNNKGKEDEIALIYVPYSAQQLASTRSDEVYLRSGDKTLKLSIEDIVRLRAERGQDIPFINLVSNVLVSEAQFHTSILKDYQEKVSSRATNIPLERLLLNQHLAIQQNGKVFLTKGGLLLLTQDPRFEIPGAYIRFLKYEGRTILSGASQNIVQDQTFTGPIPLVAQRIQDYLRSQLREFSYLGSDNRFISVPELPEEAWFEAIINSLVHRSYHLISDHIVIRLFDDRLEVISPGSYLTGVDPAEFPISDVSRPRNVAIMDFMREIKYVQMLHEGTRRIFSEMQRAGLPDPIYSPLGGTHVHVTLKNDIDRRRAAQVSAESEVSVPWLNLFRLEVQDSNPSSPDGEGKSLGYKALRTAIEKALIENGWSVSSFTHDIAMDVKKPALGGGTNFVSIHEAFRFSLQEFNQRFYLALDYKVEVRSRATLQSIMTTAPTMLNQKFGRAFARINQQWVAGYIIRVNRNEQTVLFEIRAAQKSDTKTKHTIPFSEVFPDLTSTQLSELLANSNSKFDLYRERMKLSNLPSSIRLERIREISAELSRRVFPITVENFQIYLSRELVNASSSDFQITQSLREPAVSFGNQQLSVEISKGLTSYGAYEKTTENVPLVLMAPPNIMPLLERLVENLQKGSRRFSGFSKTFGAKLEIIGKYPVSFEDYKKTCQMIVPNLPRQPLPLMLIFMPDERGLWSRANYHSPYYQVKHYLLENGIPSQGVDEETLTNIEWKDLNLALDIFAKTGHVPWVLDEGLPLADMFVGLSYSSIRIKDGIERIIAYVCVFDEFGRWQYYIGNTEPVPFEERDSRLAQLMANAVQRYARQASVSHVHIHHGHSLKLDTSSRIADAIRSIAPTATVHFLHINDNTPMRLFGSGEGDDSQIERGTFIQVRNTRKFLLATTGKSDFQTSNRGTPLIVQGSLRTFPFDGTLRGMTIYGQHILSLTRLNWASTRSFSAQPITLLYSSKVARYMNIFVQNYGSFSLHPDLLRTPWFL